MTEETPLPSLEDVVAEIEDTSTLVTRVTYQIFIVFVTSAFAHAHGHFLFCAAARHPREVWYLSHFATSLIYCCLIFGVRLVSRARQSVPTRCRWAV